VSYIRVRFLALALLAAPLALANTAGVALIQGSAEQTAGRRVAGADGATFELPGGIRVVLAPRAEAFIAPKSQLLALWPGKRVPTYSVFLRSGRVTVDVPEGTAGKGAVVVAAPDETRVLFRSGRGVVQVGSRRLLALCETGLVSVSEGVRFRDAPAGIIREVTRGKSSDHPMLAATQITGRALWVVTRANTALAGYRWAPVEGAQSYEVGIYDRAIGQRVVYLETQTPELPPLPKALPPGQYEIGVRALDRYGLPGKAGNLLSLRVVGVKLPEGANLLGEDRIQLEAGQAIRLLGAEGLMVSRGGTKDFIPPTEPIVLRDERMSRLMLRVSPEGASHWLSLVPKKTRIVATAGPKDVIWPVEPVRLEVRLDGDDASQAEPGERPVARVLVGVDPLEVTWRRRGDTWHAEVPPQPGPGPWVVRLEVRNRHGAVVARDSVEVVPMRASQWLSRAAVARQFLERPWKSAKASRQ
jgi:hypothetical protein